MTLLAIRDYVAGADLADLPIVWRDETRRIIPFSSSPHTFSVRISSLASPDVALVVKTDGIVGYDDQPNVVVSWDATGQLHDLPAGTYLALLTATRNADGRRRVQRFKIRMLRGVPTALPAPAIDPTLPDDAWLRLYAADPETLLMFGDIGRDGNGNPTTADVVWPDGTTGTYTTLVAGTHGVDSYTVTYDARTVTQPAVTRNGAGQIIVRPALTVS